MAKTAAMQWRDDHSRIYVVLTSEDIEEAYILTAYLSLKQAAEHAKKCNAVVAKYQKEGKKLFFIETVVSFEVKDEEAE